MSRPTLPRVPARALQIALAVLAVLGLVAVLALTALARSQPPPDRGPSWRVLLVPDITSTTTRPPGYVPVPAGPPCPAAEGEGSR